MSTEENPDNSSIEVVLYLSKVVCLKKENEQMKWNLAFLIRSDIRKTKWNISKYRKRKQVRQIHKLAKPDAYKAHARHTYHLS